MDLTPIKRLFSDLLASPKSEKRSHMLILYATKVLYADSAAEIYVKVSDGVDTCTLVVKDSDAAGMAARIQSFHPYCAGVELKEISARISIRDRGLCYYLHARSVCIVPQACIGCWIGETPSLYAQPFSARMVRLLRVRMFPWELQDDRGFRASPAFKAYAYLEVPKSVVSRIWLKSAHSRLYYREGALFEPVRGDSRLRAVAGTLDALLSQAEYALYDEASPVDVKTPANGGAARGAKWLAGMHADLRDRLLYNQASETDNDNTILSVLWGELRGQPEPLGGRSTDCDDMSSASDSSSLC